MNSSEVVARTKFETASSYRVWAKDWMFSARGTQEYLMEFYEENYAGRLHEGDWSIEKDGESYALWIRLWYVQGEWKDQALADAHVTELVSINPEKEFVAIPRNARREHVLTSYGKLKLPAGAPADS